MSGIGTLTDNYHINRLSNAEIFNNHGLKRQIEIIAQARVFEHLSKTNMMGLSVSIVAETLSRLTLVRALSLLRTG
jgi:hypothetical protein